MQPSEEPIPQITRKLVDLAREGDRQAMNALMERYLPRVLRVVRMKRGPFLGQRLEDQDLTQEVMIRVWKSLDQYDPDQAASFLLWVTRIAENALRDLARRQLAAKRNPGTLLSLEEEHERGVPDSSTHPMFTSTPSRILGRLENLQLVDTAVASLDEETRELIVLRYYFDLPLDEIGRHIGKGGEAARSQIRRALTRLRNALEDRGVEGADNPATLLRRTF